jgi:hypothetical protein
MIDRIPEWVKEGVALRGCLPAISIGSTVWIAVVPLQGAEPRMTRRFARRTYEEAPDDCWRELFQLEGLYPSQLSGAH